MAFAHRIHSLKIAGLLASGIVAAGATMGPVRAQTTYPIGVTVDGTQITFSGTQPVELHGAVLVPLRGVFEALGARVDYDWRTQTITADKDDRTVQVAIGSRTATINGQPQSLSEPAQIMSGSTMVPLRFVAEALGEYVDWTDRTHMVSITTPQAPPIVASVPTRVEQTIPPRPEFRGADQNVITGVVRQVVADSDPPQIVIRVDGQDREIPVANTAAIWRGRVGRDGAAVGLADIQPGDRVVIHRNDDGIAIRVASSFGLVYGTVSSVEVRGDGRRLVVLDDGQTVELAPSARLVRDGAPISAADLNAGDHITIATDPVDNLAYRVMVNPAINAHRR